MPLLLDEESVPRKPGSSFLVLFQDDSHFKIKGRLLLTKGMF